MANRIAGMAWWIMMVLSVAGCATPESVRALTSAQRAAIEELALAWADDHALARAELGVALDIHRVAARGRIHRELIATGCLTPEGEAEAAALGAALADPETDIALVREVRLGRMTEARAAAWLTDYSIALRLGEAGDGATVRHRLLDQLADMERIDAAWDALIGALDARAQRVAALAAEAAGASDTVAQALESRLAWRAIGEEIGAADTLGPAVDALFTDPRKRAAALAFLDQLLPSAAQ